MTQRSSNPKTVLLLAATLIAIGSANPAVAEVTRSPVARVAASAPASAIAAPAWRPWAAAISGAKRSAEQMALRLTSTNDARELFAAAALGAFASLPSAKPDLDPMTTAAVRKSVFGSVSIPIGALPGVARQDVVIRASSASGLGRCGTGERCPARQVRLIAKAAALKEQGFMTKLRSVNMAVNQVIAYRSDRAISGKEDVWSSAVETVVRGTGDCEDFAILKMAALRAAGISPKSMSLVVVRDTRRQLFHAVLAVSTDQGNFILDNLRADVVLDRSLPQYEPLYSMSESRSLIHGTTPDRTLRVAKAY